MSRVDVTGPEGGAHRTSCVQDDTWHDKNTILSLEGLLLIQLKAQLVASKGGVHPLCLMWS